MVVFKFFGVIVRQKYSNECDVSILLFYGMDRPAIRTMHTAYCTVYMALNEANFSLAIIYYGIRSKFIGNVTHHYNYYYLYLNIYERYMLCRFERPMN